MGYWCLSCGAYFVSCVLGCVVFMDNDKGVLKGFKMIEDVMIFIVEKIITPFFIITIILFICFCVLGIFFIPSCIEQDKRERQQIKECFMQEPRTKECEYILWNYELKRNTPKNNTRVMPTPMVIR